VHTQLASLARVCLCLLLTCLPSLTCRSNRTKGLKILRYACHLVKSEFCSLVHGISSLTLVVNLSAPV
jgi:hypothetical protein